MSEGANVLVVFIFLFSSLIYVFINIDLKITTCRWSQLAEEGSEGEDKLDEEEEDKENLVRNV